MLFFLFFFFSSRRRHTRSLCDWSSDVCSSDLEDRGVADQRARDGDALALPARERGAALTDHGIVAVFQLADEFVRVRGARRGLDLLRGGPGFSVRDVLADRGAEQDRLLQHQADVAPQRGPAVLADVAAVDQDRALRSEEHTSELQSHSDLVCRLLLEKKKTKRNIV